LQGYLQPVTNQGFLTAGNGINFQSIN